MLYKLFRKEVQSIRQHRYLLGSLFSFEGFVTRTSIFISILGYVLLGNILTAETAFSITAVYNALNTVITLLFSISISSLAEVNVSLKRMQNFMCYEEIPDRNTAITLNGTKNGINGYAEKPKKTPKPHVVLKNVDAKWDNEATENTLKNIDLSINENQLVAVIGPVGAGKSSLFNVILKELPISGGSISVEGVISYSSQEPWLFSGSVRDNILFGEEYDEDRYKEVVRVCALQSDFDMFPFGDRTLVGEKGKSISGGQKARINLARCVYKEADIYLLDDPLSAVDANVGKQLYDQCVKQFLKEKICILSTHQLQYLKSADKIIILDDGNIEIQGKYEDLHTCGLDFAKLLKDFNSTEDHEDDVKKKAVSREVSVLDEESDEDDDGPEMDKEKVGHGKITAAVYGNYFKAGGNWCMIGLLVAAFLASQCFANTGEYFVSYWYYSVNYRNKRFSKKLCLLSG